jgi:fumarate reductase subunit D
MMAAGNRTIPMPLEIWLRPNRRILLVATVAPALLVLLGLVVALGVFGAAPTAARVFAATLALLGGVLLVLLAWFFRQPRLAYDGRHLLVNLRSARPIEVPIEYVECFFLGSGLRRLPGRADREVQMSLLRIRLAERATEWAHRDVKPALGAWCGGYITIYGSWCEPLDIDLVNRLNARLAAAHEARQNSVAQEPSFS